MMTREDFTFPSCDGRTDIAAVRWIPDGEPHAVLQIAHGMQEHILRYDAFARFLAERGFLVVGNDHLGHGRTAKDASDLGYFGIGPSDLVVGDMHRLRLKAESAHPGLPYFMLGHSMGSFMLRKYLSLHGRGLAGAIVMGTGFTPAGTTAAGLALIRVLTLLKGERHQSAAIANLAFGKDYAPYDMTGKEPERSWLSHNVQNVKDYYADPLCGNPFTLNGYQGLMEAVQFSCDAQNARKIPADVPVLVVSGELDPVGAAGTGVRKAYNLMKEAGIRDLSLKLYPGMLHEILNEIDNACVLEDLAAWMEARI